MTRRMQKDDEMYSPVMEMVRSEAAPESIDWVAKGKVGLVQCGGNDYNFD